MVPREATAPRRPAGSHGSAHPKYFCPTRTPRLRPRRTAPCGVGGARRHAAALCPPPRRPPSPARGRFAPAAHQAGGRRGVGRAARRTPLGVLAVGGGPRRRLATGKHVPGLALPPPAVEAPLPLASPPPCVDGRRHGAHRLCPVLFLNCALVDWRRRLYYFPPSLPPPPCSHGGQVGRRGRPSRGANDTSRCGAGGANLGP